MLFWRERKDSPSSCSLQRMSLSLIQLEVCQHIITIDNIWETVIFSCLQKVHYLHFCSVSLMKVNVSLFHRSGYLSMYRVYFNRLSFHINYFFFPSGIATVVIQADMGALGTVGIADSSRNVLIGEPRDNYNGTALVR